MPANEPTLALTFQDFIVRVAEFLGVADYTSTTAGVPTDAHDLEVCERMVNDGFRRFYNSAPLWNWALPTFSITFDSEGTGPLNVESSAWRYFMPDGFFGDLHGPITYAENTNFVQIEETREDRIRELRATSDASGYPRLYAIRPLSGDEKRRWELIVWPDPSSDYTITGRCRLYPNKMTELTDRPNAGIQFDEVILAAALAEAERQREDASGIQESHFAEALVRAMAMDQRSAPNSLGDYGGRNSPSAGRVYTGVDTYTNLDGTVHTFPNL